MSSSTPEAGEKTEEEKALLKAAREARKAEKERLKAEKKAKKEAQRLAKEEAERIHDVNYLSVEDQESYEPYGDMSRIMSKSRTGRKFASVKDLDGEIILNRDRIKLRKQLQASFTWVRNTDKLKLEMNK